MEGSDVQAAQQKVHSHPSRAERRRRPWRAFPTMKTDAFFGQLSFFLSVLIVCSAYSREGLKQNTGLCVPPPCPNEGGVSGLALLTHHGQETQPPTRVGTSGKLEDKKNHTGILWHIRTF